MSTPLTLPSAVLPEQNTSKPGGKNKKIGSHLGKGIPAHSADKQHSTADTAHPSVLKQASFKHSLKQAKIEQQHELQNTNAATFPTNTPAEVTETTSVLLQRVAENEPTDQLKLPPALEGEHAATLENPLIPIAAVPVQHILTQLGQDQLSDSGTFLPDQALKQFARMPAMTTVQSNLSNPDSPATALPQLTGGSDRQPETFLASERSPTAPAVTAFSTQATPALTEQTSPINTTTSASSLGTAVLAPLNAQTARTSRPEEVTPIVKSEPEPAPASPSSLTLNTRVVRSTVPSAATPISQRMAQEHNLPTNPTTLPIKESAWAQSIQSLNQSFAPIRPNITPSSGPVKSSGQNRATLAAQWPSDLTAASATKYPDQDISIATHTGLRSPEPSKKLISTLGDFTLNAAPPSVGLTSGNLTALSEPTPTQSVWHTHLNEHPDSDAFQTSLASSVKSLVKQGGLQAQFSLNPGSLGPMTIKITLQGEQAQVSFGSDVPSTRESLEKTTGWLGQALMEVGLKLASPPSITNIEATKPTASTTFLTQNNANDASSNNNPLAGSGQNPSGDPNHKSHPERPSSAPQRGSDPALKENNLTTAQTVAPPAWRLGGVHTIA